MDWYNEIVKARENLKGIIYTTPLELNKRLSSKYGAQIYLKREDLQSVRSFKIRGAYNKLISLTPSERRKGIVCASAGNHAQGVALGCALFKIKGNIYLPKSTPRQKINRIRALGGKWIQLIIEGDTYDEAQKIATIFGKKHTVIYIHPFDEMKVIAGQGTVGLEILEALEKVPDYILIPVGGGGLMAGVSLAVRQFHKHTKLIGIEPIGAASMSASLKAGKPVSLDKLDTFVDGAAVKKPGNLSFKICSRNMEKIYSVPGGAVCSEMIDLYQHDGVIAEPAGALSVAGLEQVKNQIKGKNVVCIISGGNNDISRYPEIMERRLIYKGLKHYFIIEFPQRPGALRQFLDKVIYDGIDITLFEYIKKNNREMGPALVGLEISKKTDLAKLLKKMDTVGFKYETINADSPLFRFVQ